MPMLPKRGSVTRRKEPPMQTTTPPTIVQTNPQDIDAPSILREPSPQPPTLAADLADALSVVLDYYGGETRPRFLRPDFDAIRALIAQARP